MTEFKEKFPDTDSTFLLPGAAGNLEVMVNIPEDEKSEVIAIICHPNSTEGGSMTNKVVHTLSRACNMLNVSTVRFNFRSVGQSEGEYDAGKGEAYDLRAVVSWVRQARPEAEIILAGFSFGSFVASQVANEIPAKCLVTIAPPYGRFNLAIINEIDVPWLVVQGEADEVVDAGGVYDWVSGFNPVPELIKMPETSHFFHGKLVLLRNYVIEFLKKQI